jgi:type I restriction enzyme S subunit
VQDAQDGAVCTTGFAVLRPKAIDSMALAYLLKTDFVTAQIMRNNIGIVYPAIEESCLPDVLLPISREKATVLQDASASLFALERTVEEKRRGFREEVERLVVDWTG